MSQNSQLPIVSFTTHQVGELEEIALIETPLFIQQDLYFGRDIPGGGRVSDREFQTFVDEVISPSVIGLTQFDARGQVSNPDGSINKERSNLVTLLLEDTPENATVVNEILNTYQQRFHGAGILQVTNADDLKVSFDPTEDLIDRMIDGGQAPAFMHGG